VIRITEAKAGHPWVGMSLNENSPGVEPLIFMGKLHYLRLALQMKLLIDVGNMFPDGHAAERIFNPKEAESHAVQETLRPGLVQNQSLR